MVWIEISVGKETALIHLVTTFAVVWIEISCIILQLLKAARSPPSRWCGLKYDLPSHKSINFLVTTFAVVWIEMKVQCLENEILAVTTFAVVWIEICRRLCISSIYQSPPSRWCGLK